jgi:hypothetical protein
MGQTLNMKLSQINEDLVNEGFRDWARAGALAGALGVSWQDIQKANKISDPRKIRPGQKLVIPVESSGGYDFDPGMTDDDKADAVSRFGEVTRRSGSAEPVEPAVEPAAEYEQVEGDDAGNFVARVIFAEAASASPEERAMVAATMRNRIKHPGFGWLANDKGSSLNNMYEVVNEPKAFEAVGDSDNRQWALSARPDKMNERERQIFGHAQGLAKSPQSIKGKSGRPIVYYHDKSIDKPKSWDNDYWKTHLEYDTPKFKFYSITPR